MKLKEFLFTCAVFSIYPHNSNWFNEKKTYELTDTYVDVLIPCHEKDQDVLQLCVHQAKKFVKNVRRIIVVSEKPLTNKAEWFDESQLPFSKKSIAEEFAKSDPSFYPLQKQKRTGWYFQQLSNFYCPLIIPNISPNVLILNADTVFLQPVSFLDDQGFMLHAPGSEYHHPYFEHMERLLPGLKRVFPAFSGISHHMLFQRPVLEDLFKLVESHHQCKFWQAYCRCVDPKHFHLSGSADFEIYFNFMLQRSNQIKIRPLKWTNINRVSQIKLCQKMNFHFVSCHDWLRQDLKT